MSDQILIVASCLSAMALGITGVVVAAWRDQTPKPQPSELVFDLDRVQLEDLGKQVLSAIAEIDAHDQMTEALEDFTGADSYDIHAELDHYRTGGAA